MTDRATIRDPVLNAPPHLMDPSRTLAVWFTDPPGSIVRFARRARLTEELAEWMAGPVSARLLEQFPNGERFVFVLDLSQMSGRDPGARRIVVDAMRALAARSRRATVVPPADASRVYLASLQAAASLAQVFGLTVSVQTAEEATRELRVLPAGR